MQSDSGHGTPPEIVELSPARRRLANVVIVFVLYTSLLMACPWPTVAEKIQPLLQPTLPVLRNLGQFHRFRLFVDPPKTTGNIHFRVVAQDNTASDWVYPRSHLMPGDPPGSYNRYLFIYLFWDSYEKTSTLIPAMARYIAEQNRDKDGSLPKKVEIWQSIRSIPRPEVGIGRPPTTDSSEVRIFEYNVASQKLRTVRPPAVW